MTQATQEPKPEPDALKELKQLIKRAEKGDRTSLPELRRVLDANPLIWQHCGNLALQAEFALITLTAGKDLMLRESLARYQAALKAELAGPAAPPLERLLAERVAACSLQSAYCDAAFAQSKSHSSAQIEQLQRRQDRAARRLEQAIKMLATVRKLLQPAGKGVSAAEQKPATKAQHESNGTGHNGDSRRAAKTPMLDTRDGLEPSGDGASATIAELEIPKTLLDRMRGLVEIAD